MSEQQQLTEQQQIESIANQAISDADSVSKIYANAYHRRLMANIKAIQLASITQVCSIRTSQNQAIATLINEYASDAPSTIELPALDVTSYRDLLPSSQSKLRPPSRS